MERSSECSGKKERNRNVELEGPESKGAWQARGIGLRRNQRGRGLRGFLSERECWRSIHRFWGRQPSWIGTADCVSCQLIEYESRGV